MKAITEMDARLRLNAAIQQAGGIRQYARIAGCSPALVGDARKGHRYISGKLARALGIQRIVHKSVSYVDVEAA